MALTIKTLDARELPTTKATLYTEPGTGQTRVTELWVSNNADAVRHFTLWVVNSGGGVGDDSNQLINEMDLPQNIPIILPLNTFLDTADFIRGEASGEDCAIRISGIEEA